jgi:putative membrane protein (TIGR04086 family)
MLDKTKSRSAVKTEGYGIGSALITAYGITVPVLLILAAVLAFTDFPEKYTTIAVLIATLTGLIAAGFKSGVLNQKNGVLKGTICGLLYMIILYMASSIAYKDFMLNSRAIIMILTGILAGAVGSIIGMNRKAKPAGRYKGIGKTPNPFSKYRK